MLYFDGINGFPLIATLEPRLALCVREVTFPKDQCPLNPENILPVE